MAQPIATAAAAAGFVAELCFTAIHCACPRAGGHARMRRTNTFLIQFANPKVQGMDWGRAILRLEFLYAMAEECRWGGRSSATGKGSSYFRILSANAWFVTALLMIEDEPLSLPKPEIAFPERGFEHNTFLSYK